MLEFTIKDLLLISQVLFKANENGENSRFVQLANVFLNEARVQAEKYSPEKVEVR